MKRTISNIVSIILENEQQKIYEWTELLIKLGFVMVSVFCMIKIDVLVYGYLTR